MAPPSAGTTYGQDNGRKLALQARLREIETQMRLIRYLVDRDGCQAEVLNRISAVRAALLDLTWLLLEHHCHKCVKDALRQGEGEQAVREILSLLARAI